MAPPETGRGSPRQGRPPIALNSNSAEDDSTNDITSPVLAEVIAEAVSRGLLVGGGRFRLHGGCLRLEGRH